MKERLLQLLDLEQLTPSKFADLIGVQRSSVSHVISGRNKPSYDFLHKTLKAFPGLNASWLMMGEGTMYEQMGRKQPGDLFDVPEGPPGDQNETDIPDTGPAGDQISHSQAPSKVHYEDDKSSENQIDTSTNSAQESNEKSPLSANKQTKKVIQVMVIYEDDTFRTFTPAQ